MILSALTLVTYYVSLSVSETTWPKPFSTVIPHTKELSTFETERNVDSGRTYEANQIINARLNELKAFVQENHIDLTGFDEKSSVLFSEVFGTHLWVHKNFQSDRKLMKSAQHMRSLFDSLASAARLRNRFAKEPNEDTNLIERMADLRIRILASHLSDCNPILSASTKETPTFQKYYAVLELLERNNTIISENMKLMFDEQVSLVREALLSRQQRIT